MKIAFTTELPKEGFRRLAERGLDDWSLVSSDRSLCAEAEILVSTFDYKVPRELIESMPRLKLIANFGAGFNNIDLEVCRERGIRVTNTPQPVIEPTAELAFALMINVARRVSEFDRKVRGLVPNGCPVPEPLRFGRIGQALARRAIASGMKILYYNRHQINDDALRALHGGNEEMVRYVDFQTLLQDSDFLSLNLPYTPEVHHIIGKPELGMMKRSAYLINTARGAHVDEAALVEALKSGIIAGAALDVYEFEPAIHPDLLKLPNVVLSPHTGTGTWEGRIAMCENVTDNIIAFVENRPNAMNIVI